MSVGALGLLAAWLLLCVPAPGAPAWTADADCIDAILRDFRQKYDIAGLSFALAEDGRLLFAKGYGYADKERKIEVRPTHLFRIASVSKAITSVAVLTLVEQGKLALSDRIFGDRGILARRYGLPKGFPQLGDMTVAQLLEHSGGGWPNDAHDPMFQRYDLNRAELIRWTLAKYDLAAAPGQKYAYSNFGYLLLGRVIEQVAGQPYEEYVKSAVLRRAGISDMHVAGDSLAQRRPNEVLYYDEGDAPYRVRVSRMDAHGGWLATPTDLLRLLVRLGGSAGKAGILKPATIAVMTSPSSANRNYAKGWCVNAARNWWHSGSLPGTYAFLVRAHNGFCWAILMNQRRPQAVFAADVDRLGWTILDRVRTWPAHDLF
ncbi:MAG: serine hydrolase domain-containing protein [Thermoguttaceae bacterium]|jgi:CubicO group peptidase (beta-lactamase class C family)